MMTVFWRDLFSSSIILWPTIGEVSEKFCNITSTILQQFIEGGGGESICVILFSTLDFPIVPHTVKFFIYWEL